MICEPSPKKSIIKKTSVWYKICVPTLLSPPHCISKIRKLFEKHISSVIYIDALAHVRLIPVPGFCHCCWIVHMKSYRMVYIRSSEKNSLLRKSDAKKIWWKSYKSCKYIKKVNKILLQYHYNIFQSSFGYGIFKGNTPLFCAPKFSPSFRRHKRRIGCSTISCNWSWLLYSIGTYVFKLVSKSSLHIQQPKYVQNIKRFCKDIYSIYKKHFRHGFMAHITNYFM